MKKIFISLMLLAALCVPWVTQAQCDPIGTFPIAYGFETSEGFTSASNPTTNTLGTCWGNVATVTSGATAERLWYVSTSNKHSGNQALCLPDKNVGNITVLTFPAMNFTYSNGYLLTIWVYRNASGSSYPNEGVRVYASNTNTVTASSVELGFLYRNCTQTDGNIVTAESATGWYQYEFPITLTGTVYLIFQGESSYGSATYLDDISIEPMPTCKHPYNVVASDFETDGATLSWTPSGNGETSYQYVCVPVGETPNWNNATIVNAPTVTLTGLSSSTVYDFYVRSYCGSDDQSSVIQGQFRTACGMLTLPFFTDFESETAGGASISTYPNFIPCWTRLNDASSANYQGYPYIYNTTTAGYTHSGTKLLYIYSYKGTSTLYPNYDIAVMPQLNTAVNPVNSLRLKFWGRSNTSSASPDVTIGVMSDPNDESTFVPVTTLTLTGTTMTEYVIPLTSYTGTGAYVAFRCDRNETSSAAAYIDDVTLESMPTCLDPSLLAANAASITNSSCQLTWTNGASETQWNVRYRVDGTAEWTELASPISTNPYTLTGLSAATTYNVQVRAYCSATDQSPWSNIATFTTLCDAFAMPFSEDFNTLTSGIPLCWNNEEGTTTNASYKWNFYADGYDGSCVRFNSYTNASGATNVLASPMITLTGHSMLNFMAKDPSGDKYSVLIGVSGSATRDTLVSNLQGTTDWVEQDIDLNAYTGQTVVIYFCGTSNYGSGDAYLYLDNFSIQAAPTCIKPAGITFDDITAHTASVSWTSRGSETAWNIRYKESTDTAWIDIPGTVTNPYTLSGLDMNTYYDVQVRSYCSAEDQSDWTFTETMLSGCEAISELPWTEDFEQVGTGSSSSPAPNCWDMTGFNNGATPYCYVSSTTSMSGSKCLLFSTQSNSPYGYLAFPEFDAPINTLRMTFSYKNANLTTAGKFAVGYMSDVTDGSTFVVLQEFERCTTATAHTVYFDEVPPRGNARIAFRFGDGTASYSNSSYIDNITVELIPTCADPSGLTLDTITSSDATLSWTANGSETAWNIRYKASADTAWTDVAGTVSNPATITGLQSNTAYDVQVRAYCSADDQSPWTPSLSIRTACANITSLPWTVDFEDMTASTIPLCWDNSGSSTSTVSGTSSYYVWGVYNYGGNNMMRMYNYYVQSGSALINSLPITIPDDGTTYELKFDYSNHSSSGDMLVKVSTDNGATFTTIGNYSNLTGSTDRNDPGTFSNAEIYLSDYAGETIILQFYNLADYGSGAIFVDNITICAAPSCLVPTDLVASNITTTSATIGWTANGAATAWNLRYKLSSASEWTVVDGTVANPYTLTNILPSSTYDVQVRGYCSAEDQSDWSDSYTFATACEVIAVTDANTYTEGFESSTLPACWSQDYVSYTQDWTIGSGDNGSITSAHGGIFNAVFAGTSYDGLTTKLISPVFDLSALDSAKLSFWHAQAAWGSDQNELSVYYRTSATGEWTLLTAYTNSITSWTEETFTLPAIGSYYQLAFEGVNNYGYDVVIDDITICAAPTEPEPVVYDTMYATSFNKTYYAADNDWYCMLSTASEDTSFYFDIVADSIVNGQTYTLANMLPNYSGMAVGSNFNSFSAATFTYTADQTLMRENIVATGTVNGTNYVILYDGEIDTGMHYDTRYSDFVENFTLAQTEIDDDYFATYGVVDVTSTNVATLKALGLEFYVSSLDADITIPEGVYAINNSEMPGTVVASPGVIGDYVYPSFAAMLNTSGNLDSVWFMERGTVTVRKVNGLFTALVEATNSYGRTIHALIGDTNATPVADSVTVVMNVNDATMGSTNPTGTVRYAVGETVSATATANEGYHFVNWTIGVMGMTVPMNDNPLSYQIPAMVAGMTLNVTANFAADTVPPTPVVYDTVHVSNYEKTYYAADNDWYYELYNPESDTTFYFDIVADSIVSGHTYTLSDMLPNYSGMVISPSTQYFYSAATLTHTINATTSQENIVAVVTLTNGQNYVILYDGEIDTGMHYDTRYSDFVENFTLAQTEIDDDYFATYGVVDVSSTNVATLKALGLEFYVSSLDADITIPEGVYAINNSEMPGTVVASPGVIGGYVYPSFAAMLTASGNLDSVWFMERGTVTVRKVNGLFTALVEATNSYGRTIHALIGDTNATPVADSVTVVMNVNDATMGSTNPTGTVRYAVGETVSATATANEGYHFVNWTIGVMGMTVPMNDNPLSYQIPAMVAGMTLNVTANFAADTVPPTPDSVTVVFAVNDTTMGYINHTGTMRFAVGETVTATATAYEGYRFDTWTIGVMGMIIPFAETTLSYEIPSIAAGMTLNVTANFVSDTTPISHDSVTVVFAVNDTTMGYTNPMGTMRFAVGETVTATAIAYEGYEFVNWAIGVTGMTVPFTENPLTYEIPSMAAGMTVMATANFQRRVGINTVDDNVNVNIYPNPASEVAHIALSGATGEVTLSIVDMNGRTVKKVSCQGETTYALDVRNLAQGAYFVRINSENCNIIRKLVVR